MKNWGILGCIATLVNIADAGWAQVVISEIMYNPRSYEAKENNQVEWVEIYNAGKRPVKLKGWYLQDEDGKTTPMPRGEVLEAGKAVVLIPKTQQTDRFHAAWGEDIHVVRLVRWAYPARGGLNNLANTPSNSNEALQLMDSDDDVIDEVNYDDEGEWPSDEPQGSSIYLLPDALDPESNDLGKSWQASKVDTHGAWMCKTREGYSSDIGSPGTVAVPEATESP